MPVDILVMRRNVLMGRRRSLTWLLGWVIVSSVRRLVCSCILWCCRIGPLRTSFTSYFWMDCLVRIVNKLYTLMTIHQRFNYSLSPESVMATCTVVCPPSSMPITFNCWNFYQVLSHQFSAYNHARWRYSLVSNPYAWYASHAYASMRLISTSYIAR